MSSSSTVKGLENSAVFSLFSTVMVDEKDVAAALVSDRLLTLQHFQLAIEWQRERGGSLLDILVEMRATTDDQIQRTANRLRTNLEPSSAAAPAATAADGVPATVVAPAGDVTSKTRHAAARRLVRRQSQRPKNSFALGTAAHLQKPDDERRLFDRLGAHGNLFIEIEDRAGREIRLKNLSLAGIGYESPSDLTIGRLVEVKMASIDGVAIALDGIVRRCDPTGDDGYSIGIEFDDVGAAAGLVLNSILKTLR